MEDSCSDDVEESMEYLRIQSKDDLKEWLQFEEELYFGGGGENIKLLVFVLGQKIQYFGVFKRG